MFAGMAVFLSPYNYEFCRAYERKKKNTRIFCLSVTCGAFLWVVEFVLGFNILAISANRVYR